MAKGLVALRHVKSSKPVSLVSAGDFSLWAIGEALTSPDYIWQQAAASKQGLTQLHQGQDLTPLSEDAIQLTTDIKNIQTKQQQLGLPGGRSSD